MNVPEICTSKASHSNKDGTIRKNYSLFSDAKTIGKRAFTFELLQLEHLPKSTVRIQKMKVLQDACFEKRSRVLNGVLKQTPCPGASGGGRGVLFLQGSNGVGAVVGGIAQSGLCSLNAGGARR